MKSNIDIYLLTRHAGGQSRKNLHFPGSCAKIKNPCASYLFCLFRWGNNTSGDNNAMMFKALSYASLSDLLLPGILHKMGIMNTIRSRKENGCRSLNDMFQATQTEDGRTAASTVKFSRSCSFHVNHSYLRPHWTYFFQCNCFSFGSTLLFPNDNQSSERYSSITEQNRHEPWGSRVILNYKSLAVSSGGATKIAFPLVL